MKTQPDPIDISMALKSIEDVTTTPPFSGTTTIVYRHYRQMIADEEHVSEEVGEKDERFAPYFGKTLLIDLTNNKEPEITAGTLIKALDSVERDFDRLPEHERYIPPRLLIKTRRRHEKPGDSDSHFSIDAIEYMYSRDFWLVGIDTPSINQSGGDDLIEWQLKERQIVWLVNLDLSHCKGAGKYILIAMPLVDVEEGPVPARAILIPMP